MDLPLTRFRWPAAVLGMLVLAASFSACDNAGPGTQADVTVMTRNLYLGANLFLLLQAQTPQEVPAIAGQLYGQVLASNFAERAAAIAAEIDAHDPHLVGLQEVSLYRTDRPSDYQASAGAVNAQTVELDFLALLMTALEARGLNYVVAATNTNADVELPATDGTTLFDVRLTDSDVILRRSDVPTTNAVSGTFAVAAPVPIGGQNVAFIRGFSHLTATVGGVPFTFANTHLEVGGAAVQAQLAQAAQFKSLTANLRTPVIAVGDFNSDPTDAGADGDSYRALTTGAGAYRDAWTSSGGFTCCQAADLMNATSTLDERIDLILYRGDVSVVNTTVVGDAPADRTPGGLWPSDHAGVVATLRVRAD